MPLLFGFTSSHVQKRTRTDSFKDKRLTSMHEGLRFGNVDVCSHSILKGNTSFLRLEGASKHNPAESTGREDEIFPFTLATTVRWYAEGVYVDSGRF